MSRHRGRRGKSPKRRQRTPTIGLALITKDEELDLPALLDSVVGAFDHVVLVDTGSSDRTVELFRDWARRHRQRHTIAAFSWRDDFAAARTYADSLLTTDWTCFADADDVIERARLLRLLAATAPRDVAAFVFPYDYLLIGPDHRPVQAGDPEMMFHVTYLRERLVRRGAGTWVGRTHETQVIDGRVELTEVSHWVHNGTAGTLDGSSEARDLAILRRWAADDPDNLLLSAGLAAQEHGDETGFDDFLSDALKCERQRVASSLREPWTIDNMDPEAGLVDSRG